MTDDKEVPEKIPDQALLMLKLGELASYSAKQQTIPIFPIDGKNEPDFIGYRRFNNLCVVDSDFPYALPNMILSSDKESSSMLQLSTLQLSLLVPRIRIFKTVFDTKMEEEMDIELPFDDVAQKSDLESILAHSTGRGSGTGLKSFEWKSLGKNQANLAQFSATLKLFLLNIEEIQQIRNSKLLPNGRNITVSVLDLLYQKPDLRSGINEGSNIFDPKYFGIKVEVGWHLDTSVHELFKTESKKNGDDGEKILSVVLKQKGVFYLTLSNHDISFNKDGSIDLTIDYIASAEMDMSDAISSNILKLNAREERTLQEMLKKQKDINKEINAFRVENGKDLSDFSAPKVTHSFFDVDDKFDRFNRSSKADQSLITSEKSFNDDVQRLKDEKKAIDQELEAIKKHQKASRMSSIIQRMLDYNLINVLGIDDKSYNALVAWKTMIIEDSDDLNQIQQIVETYRNNSKVIPTSTLDKSARETIQSVSEIGNTNSGKSVLKFDEFTVGTKGPPETTRTDISFFFLGDLLNIVLESLFNDDATKPSNFIHKNVRVLLGPITYYDFGSLEDTGMIVRTKGVKKGNGYVVVYRGKQTIVNMADIPISVREFSKWFIDKIINKARDAYSFLDFAKDIIDDLVISSIAGETFKFAPRQQVRINMFPFSAPLNQHNEDVFSAVINTPDRLDIKSFRLSIGGKKTLSSNKELMPFLNSNTDSDRQDYLLFYGTNQPPLDRIADQNKDLEQKIYHLFIGEERGLLKEVNFARDDNPRQRAVNIQQSNPEKQGEGMYIREKYSANISMVGNFLFMPGQQVFVHPTYPGLKGKNVRENIFRKLGLGGYYRIIETTGKIAAGEFTTDLRTKWDAFGDGTLNIGDQMVGETVTKEFLSGHEDYEMEQSIVDTYDVKVIGE